MTINLTLHGRPITKKNSPRIITKRKTNAERIFGNVQELKQIN